MALPDAYRAINLADFNVGAAAAVAFINPLTAQLDALLALGLGPFKLRLAAQFNAALALQASLGLQIGIGNFALIASLKASIAALAALQASLAGSLALGLPPITIGLSAELSATAALSASLRAELGGLELLIAAAIRIKIPAIEAAAGLNAALSAGPFFAVAFSNTNTAAVSAWLAAEVANGGLQADSLTLNPAAPTYGVLIFGSAVSAQASFDAIIKVPQLPVP